MATFSRDEAARQRAGKHAQRSWTFALCEQICKGKGGRTSHQNMHLKKAGLPKGDWTYLKDHRDEYAS